MTVSAEGRVENQKLNQTAALLSFGWVFGFQLDLLEKKLTTLLGFTFTFFSDHTKKSDHDVIGTINWQPSAEGRVEHQKLNQTAP